MLAGMMTTTQRDSAADFYALMAIYEDNYVRFNRLAGDLRGGGNVGVVSISRRARDIDLRLQVLERCKYTTTVSLTYRFVGKHGALSAPDMKIRLYHDSRQAEVVSCCRLERRRYRWLRRSACRSTLQWRWRMNRFLFKWLNHCLKSGHGFPQEQAGAPWHDMLQNAALR